MILQPYSPQLSAKFICPGPKGAGRPLFFLFPEALPDKIGAKYPVKGFKHPVNGAKHFLLGAKHPVNGAKYFLFGAKHPVNGAKYFVNGANYSVNGANYSVNGANYFFPEHIQKH